MRKPVHSSFLLVFAFFSMSTALMCSTVTISRGGYRGVLLAAIGLMLLADAICLKEILRKHPVWIVIAGAMMLPSLFIIWDFCSRGPHVFGLVK